MEIKKAKDGLFEVSSKSKPGTKRLVNAQLETCTCPGYFKTLWCQHLKEVKARLSEKEVVGIIY